MTTKQRARKVTIRLQTAANRCHWFSSTELAVYLLTGDTCWMSHNEVPVFTSKLIFMMHECCRLMEDRSPGLLQAAHASMDTMEFELHRATLNTISVQPPDEFAPGAEVETEITSDVHHAATHSTSSHDETSATQLPLETGAARMVDDSANLTPSPLEDPTQMKNPRT